MEIKIKIPKEFEEHFNTDRFKDSLERIYTDLKYHTNYKIFGNYELEAIKMLEDSLIKAEVIEEVKLRLDMTGNRSERK